MDEIVERPKYSRQTGTQRRNRRNTGNEMMSTVFAAKMLIVVVFLSVLALCKAAHTPTTDAFVSKVKEITTINYDVNKYIVNAATSLGIKLPEGNGRLEKIADGEQGKDEKDGADVQTSSIVDKANTGDVDMASNTNESSVSIGNEIGATSNAQVLGDAEIKAIADKYSFIVPVKGEIISPFGTRTAPLSSNPEFHTGIDIEANMGSSIQAALAGEVVEVGTNQEYNKYVKIKHIDGITTIYGHCSILVIKVGQKVSQGDVVAKVGNSEDDSSSSLHFEVWKNNKLVDPGKLFGLQNGVTEAAP